MHYLLDTNHASKLLEGAESLIRRINALRDKGNRFGISVSIVGELFFAAYASKRKEENLRRLKDFLEDIVLWDYNVMAAEEFGRIQAEQKLRGQPIPPIDAQIAAVARIHNLTILTADHHFGLVDGLSIENWL